MWEKSIKALRRTWVFLSVWGATLAGFVITFSGIYQSRSAKLVACILVLMMFALSYFRDKENDKDQESRRTTEDDLRRAKASLKKIGTWEQNFKIYYASYNLKMDEVKKCKQDLKLAEDEAHARIGEPYRTRVAEAKKDLDQAKHQLDDAYAKLVQLREDLAELTGRAPSAGSPDEQSEMKDSLSRA